MSFLDSFKDLIQRSEDRSVFGGSLVTATDLEQLCIDFLKDRGYNVIQTPRIDGLHTIEDLVNYFYDLYNFHRCTSCRLVSNRKKDVGILSSFVKQRQKELNVSYREALKDVALIMEGLFVYEEELGLTTAPSIQMFGAVNCKWLTDKVIDLINTKESLLLQSRAEQKAKQWAETKSSEYRGLDIIYKK